MGYIWLRLQRIALPAVLAVALWRFAGLKPKDYGGFATVSDHWLQFVGDSVGVFMTAGLAFFLARNVARVYLGDPAGFGVAQVFPESGPLKQIAWLYVSVSAGIVESALFIGLPWLLYRSSGTSLPRYAFVALMCSLFAAAHWEHGNPVVVGAFVFNLTSWFWFFHYRNLWPLAAGHALTDLLAFA